MSEPQSTEENTFESPVVNLLPEKKHRSFLRYWDDYRSVPGHPSDEELALQADLAAGALLPIESELHPATAVAVATGLLRYHRDFAEGLAGAFAALAKLENPEPLREPLDEYVVYALEELSFRLRSLAREIKSQP